MGTSVSPCTRVVRSLGAQYSMELSDPTDDRQGHGPGRRCSPRYRERFNRPFPVYHFPREALTHCPQLCMGIQPDARFPARSADALPATLHGHLTQAIYRNRPIQQQRHEGANACRLSMTRRAPQYFPGPNPRPFMIAPIALAAQMVSRHTAGAEPDMAMPYEAGAYTRSHHFPST